MSKRSYRWDIRSRDTRTIKHYADIVDANPGTKVAHEPISLHGDEKPWPCLWPGCMEPALETACLCAEHEMVYIAQTDKRSPEVKNVTEWNDQLHDRSAWLLPVWTAVNKERKK